MPEQEQDFAIKDKFNDDIDNPTPDFAAPEYAAPEYTARDDIAPDNAAPNNELLNQEPKIGYSEAREMTRRKVAAMRAEWEAKQRAAWTKRKAHWLGFFGIFSDRQ